MIFIGDGGKVLLGEVAWELWYFFIDVEEDFLSYIEDALLLWEDYCFKIGFYCKSLSLTLWEVYYGSIAVLLSFISLFSYIFSSS